MFHTSEAQKRLLNVCSFINFMNPPAFHALAKVNEFVTNFVNKYNDAQKEHKSLPCPSICHITSIYWIFLFLLSQVT